MTQTNQPTPESDGESYLHLLYRLIHRLASREKPGLYEALVNQDEASPDGVWVLDLGFGDYWFRIESDGAALVADAKDGGALAYMAPGLNSHVLDQDTEDDIINNLIPALSNEFVLDDLAGIE